MTINSYRDNSVLGVYRPSYKTRWARPLIGWHVPAGFPSPAEDYVEGRIDLTKDLIRHPAATYYIRVGGDSMIDADIHPGALLVVDRAAETCDGCVVVARIGELLTIKTLSLEDDGRIRLMPANIAYEPIEITEEMDFEVWGRVMYSINKH